MHVIVKTRSDLLKPFLKNFVGVVGLFCELVKKVVVTLKALLSRSLMKGFLTSLELKNHLESGFNETDVQLKSRVSTNLEDLVFNGLRPVNV